MTIPGSANPLLMRSAAPTAYQVERSLRFNSSDSAYLSRTPASAGNRKTWTWAGWVKRSETGTASKYIFATTNTSGNDAAYLYFNGDNLRYWDRRSSGDGLILTTNGVFRDSSAWYHIVLAVDYANATSTNRAKLYVNGVEQTYSTANYPDTAENSYVNAAVTHYIAPGAAYFDGYLADIHFIDGQALTPSSFTEVSATTGQLIPKAYTGTFGTNGFWLKFSDNSNNTAATLGKDYSPNGNNWTPNNLSVAAGAGNDSLVDTPTSYGTDTGAGGEVRGNYCTFNPLKVLGSTATFSNGNLDISTTSVGFPAGVGTVGVSSGKWYWEITPTGGSGRPQIGVCKDSDTPNSNGIGGSAGAYIYESDQYKANNGTFTSYGASFTTNDVIGVALDLDAGTITFYKNGSSQGQAFSGLSGTFFPVVSEPDNAASITASANFGQRPFAYTAPSGFKALCDTNLPAPVVAKSASAFDVKLYTGTAATQSITGLGFSPDLVWIKQRNDGFYWHNIIDSVRGAAKLLSSNSTNAEDTAKTDSLTSFNSDGFTLGADTIGPAGVNRNAGTHVAWCWDAGTTTSSNVAGSITSSVRANASAGFSIVTYTGNGSSGATVGHGLGVAPAFFVVKRRNAADSWLVYHSFTGNTKYLLLNNTTAAATYSGAWNDAGPSSTTITLGNDVGVNANGGTYVCYAWAPLSGYSSFGSYTGNGSTDGPFVFCGFRPRWILVKRTDGVIQWTILDTARSPSNVADQRLFPNLSQAETVNGDGNTDLLSNGFKPRNIDSAFNANGGTYIYAAFAESPFQFSRAR